MAYEYDVFISYKHGFSETWIDEIFLPVFLKELEGPLGRPPTYFKDNQGGIDGGDVWRLKIKSGLATSCCLVGIWSPSYFYSDWCQYEVHCMIARSKKYGYMVLTKPTSLVQNVIISDGQSFPDYACDIQGFPCQEYNIDGGYFPQTEAFIKFQLAVRNWVIGVADTIKNAPAWDQSMFDDLPLDPGSAGVTPPPPPVVLPPVLGG